jgi:hypothetical protein
MFQQLKRIKALFSWFLFGYKHFSLTVEGRKEVESVLKRGTDQHI